jgi:peptidyl-prolyl cis-trans isomerase B (cyclophilin B)
VSRPVIALLAALCLAVALPACGSKKHTGKTGSATKTTAQAAVSGATGATAPAKPTGPPKCLRVAQPKPKTGKAARAPRPTLTLNPAAENDVVMTTSCGQFTIRLDAKRAPKTTASFASLAKRGFYDHLTFQRISPGFVIQGGDPTGTGRGGPGYQVVEPPPTDLQYTKYVVAMAKTQLEDPGTSGSQFFIVTVDDSALDAQYALVGKVVSGTDVVDLIGTQEIDPATERPLKPVVIESAKLQTAAATAKPAAGK